MRTQLNKKKILTTHEMTAKSRGSHSTVKKNIKYYRNVIIW